VGLVARFLEAEGFSTIALTPIPEFQRVVGMARVAGIEHPFGRPVGQVHDAEGQRAVLIATLSCLEKAEKPGQVFHLPFTWPEPPKGVNWHPAQASPAVKEMVKEMRKTAAESHKKGKS